MAQEIQYLVITFMKMSVKMNACMHMPDWDRVLHTRNGCMVTDGTSVREKRPRKMHLGTANCCKPKIKRAS